MLKALAVLLSIGISSIAAVKTQGVLLYGHNVWPSTERRVARYGGDLDDTIPRCAERAANDGAASFSIIRVRPFANGDDAYDCMYGAQEIEAATSQPKSDLKALALTRSSKVAACEGNCSTIADFHDAGYVSTGDDASVELARIRNNTYLSYAHCQGLMLSHNEHLPPNEPKLTFVTYSQIFVTTYHNREASRRMDIECKGGEKTDFRRPMEVYAGLLSPISFRKYFAASNIYDVGQIGNISCSQKDLPYEFYSDCSHFDWEYNGPSHPNRPLPSAVETLVPTAYQAVYISSARERFSLTYEKIAQSASRIFSPDLHLNPSLQGHHIYTYPISAYTATEAVQRCAELSVKKMRRTFNLYLAQDGWQCTTAFEQLTSPELLSTPDESVLQSYMYSAHINSMRDPDGVVEQPWVSEDDMDEGSSDIEMEGYPSMLVHMETDTV